MYPTHELGNRRNATHRTWLAAGGGLAALLVLLILVMAACNARSDQAGGLTGGTATAPAAGAGGSGDGESASGVGPGGAPGGGGEQGGGEPAGGGDGGGEPGGGEDPDDAEDTEDTDAEDVPEPVQPLSIEVTVDTVTPGGQCFAAGTIAVSGGAYPLTVHYQWRRLVFGGGLDGDPVSAVQNVTLDGPGEVAVQTNQLPEDGTNVMLVVTGPKSAGSGITPYDGCSDPPGEIGAGG
jgi:hypothetical protein